MRHGRRLCSDKGLVWHVLHGCHCQHEKLENREFFWKTAPCDVIA